LVFLVLRSILLQCQQHKRNQSLGLFTELDVFHVFNKSR